MPLWEHELRANTVFGRLAVELPVRSGYVRRVGTGVVADGVSHAAGPRVDVSRRGVGGEQH